MTTYVRQQSLGEIIANSFGLYFRNFVTLFLIYVVLLIPVAALYAVVLVGSGPAEADIVAGFGMMVIGVLAVAAITVALSDICLGNPTSLGRAYGRAFSKALWRVLGTYLLLMIVLLIGFMLLIVPGLILSAMLICVMPVVVLEERGGFDAMSRAIQLAKGKYWRNFGAVVIIGLILSLAQAAIGAVVGAAIGAVAYGGSAAAAVLLVIVSFLLSSVLSPVYSVVTVLLYYDLRSRKEGYDQTTLRNDLMR